MFVYEQSLMIGMDTGLFVPHETLTCEQAIMIIARLDGDSYLEYMGQAPFADVNTYRSDNGSEFIARHLRDWFSELSIAPMYITPGSPWENGYCERFNSRMADELLNREIFDAIFEAKALLSR